MNSRYLPQLRTKALWSCWVTIIAVLMADCGLPIFAQQVDEPIGRIDSLDFSEKWTPGAYPEDFKGPHAVAQPAKLPGVANWRMLTYPASPGGNKRLNSTLSPDGKSVAVLGDAMICIYDVQTRELLGAHACMATETAWCTQVCWHPSGELLAIHRTDGIVELRRVEDWKLSAEMPGLKGNVYKLEWSPDGNWLSSYKSNQIALHDRDGFLERVSPQHAKQITDYCWSADSKFIVSADGTGIYLWSLEKDTFQKIVTNRFAPHHVCFSGDGSRIASLQKYGIVRIYDRHGTQISAWETKDRNLQAVEMVWNGKRDQIWMITSRGVSAVWTSAGDPVHLIYSGIGPRTITFSRDAELVLIDNPDRGTAVMSISAGRLPFLASSHVGQIRWAADGRTLVASVPGGEMRLFTPDGKKIKTLYYPQTAGAVVRFNHEGTHFSASPVIKGYKTVRLRGLTADRKQRTKKLPRGAGLLQVWTRDGDLAFDLTSNGDEAKNIVTTAWSPDGSLFVAYEDQSSQIWNLDGKAEEPVLHEEAIWLAEWSKTANLLALRDRMDNLIVWDPLEDKKVGLKVQSPENISWRPGYPQLSVGAAKTWKQGDSEIHEMETVVNQHHGDWWTRFAEWSPDGKVFAHTDPLGVVLSPVGEDIGAEPRVVRRLEGLPLAHVHGLAWSPDNSQVLVGNTAHMRLYDAESLQHLASYVPLMNSRWLITTPAGAFLNGEPEEFDNAVFYSLELTSGEHEVLTASEFFERFELPR